MSAVRRWTWPIRTPGSMGRSLRCTGVTLPWVVMPRVLQLVEVRGKGPRPRARARRHEAAERRRLDDLLRVGERLGPQLACPPPREESATEGVARPDRVDDVDLRRRDGHLVVGGDHERTVAAARQQR